MCLSKIWWFGILKVASPIKKPKAEFVLMLLNIYSTCQVFVRRWKRWMAGSSTRNICWRPASKVKHQNHAIHIISCSLLILDPFLSSFSWSNICRLPPLTMNNYSFVCFLFDQCCTQHQSQIWNKEVVKQSQRKGEKVQRTLTKRTEVSLGDFFMKDPNLFLFMTRR